MNSGLSGFTLTHSDIGGYTNLRGIDGTDYIRTEFFMTRWIEMAAFSDIVMRSHPSNMPETLQLWTSPRIILHLKKFVDIHVALRTYKQFLIEEATKNGTPVVRPLMLHFPADIEARKIYSQFMLGENILVTPVFGEMEHVDVYLPGKTEWTHLWTGTTYKVKRDGLNLRNFLVMHG